jgi:predicted oxidoreductase
MQTITLGNSPIQSSRLAYGCWRLAGARNAAEMTPDLRAAGRRAAITAYEAGYTLFDHADIYGSGEAETIFGAVLREVAGMRERILIVTKGGVRRLDDPPGSPYHFNLSREHLVRACEGSLQRLGVETIDLYLLHRADWLMQPAEIAAAFEELKSAGKVRFFGVSNFRPAQVAALQAACPMPLIANQVEISLGQMAPLDDGTLDQCLERKITPMAWSPLGGGQFADGAKRLLKYQEGYCTDRVVPLLDEFATHHGVSRSAVAFAWLLKHPAGIMPIVGSTNPDRIRDAVRATEFELSREEWYRLFVAARGEPLP